MGLAPRQVFRAPSLTRRAVGSYPAFSPLPPALRPAAVCFLWHCLSRPAFADRARGHAGLPADRGQQCDRFPWACALWSSDFPPAACATSDTPPFQDRREPKAKGPPTKPKVRRPPTTGSLGRGLTAGGPPQATAQAAPFVSHTGRAGAEPSPTCSASSAARGEFGFTNGARITNPSASSSALSAA